MKKRSKFKNIKTIECFNCKQIGLEKSLSKQTEGSSNYANMVQTDDSAVKEIFFGFHLESAWKHRFLISSCSYHMTSHKEWFTTFRSRYFDFDYLGDNKACVVTGIRQIKIVMDKGGMRTLNYFRYIIKLRKNLISLGTLHVNGFSYKFNGNREIMTIRKNTLTIMRAKRIVGKYTNYWFILL